MVACLELCWTHRRDTPNRCRGTNNDAIFKPCIINTGQRDCLFCVGGAPLVAKIVGRDGGSVKKHCVKCDI